MSNTPSSSGPATAQHDTRPYAFATLVTTDEYLPAALVLAHSLRLAHSSSSSLSTQDKRALGVRDGSDAGTSSGFPTLGPWRSSPSATSARSDIDLVAIVTPATLSVQSIRALLTVYDRVLGVEPISIPSVLAMQQQGDVPVPASPRDVDLETNRNLALLGRLDLGPDRGAALTKLHAWRLHAYQKVIFLDADTLVLRPIAHLFLSSYKFAAAPDTGWPDIFNSGVMLLTPGDADFAGLLQLAGESGSWDGADQGLINEYFGGEVGSGGEGAGGGWSRLSFTYNTTALGGYTYAPAFQRFGSRVNVAHFIGNEKPWRTRSRPSLQPGRKSDASPDDMAARWWDVYDTFYPSTSSQTARSPGEGGDVEVRITEKGVEIVERPSAHSRFQVPVYQSAWNAVGASAGHIGPASIEDLQNMAERGANVTTQDQRGGYESMPLFGRTDLLPPRIRPVAEAPAHSQADSTPIPSPGAHVHTTTQAPKAQSPPTDPQRVEPSAMWDATKTSPPHTTAAEAHQMRNPPETYFPNVWDQPSHLIRAEEEERRRQVLNPNLRGRDLGHEFGYIPPAAREIHSFAHLGGDKPDENKVTAVFPWEQRGAATARPGPAQQSRQADASAARPSRVFPEDEDHSHGQPYDPSLSASRIRPTRTFEDFVISSITGSPASIGSVSELTIPANLVDRYKNAWDEVMPAIGRSSSARSAEDPSHHGHHHSHSRSEHSGRRSRRGTRSGGSGVESGVSSTGTRSRRSGSYHRPTSHYVPNVYDDYVPAQPTAGITAAFMSRQGSLPSASDYSLEDSLNSGGEGLTQSLGGGGGTSTGTGAGGFGEVEGSSSWSSHLADIVRMGARAGDGSGSGSGHAHSSSWGGRRQGRHGGEDDDGDDESSSEETQSRRRGGGGGGGGGSSSEGFSPPTSPPVGPTSGSGTSSFAAAPALGFGFDSADAVPIPFPREGPGYTRKAQASNFVRSNITPRSPRHGGHALPGSPGLSGGSASTSGARGHASLGSVGSIGSTASSASGSGASEGGGTKPSRLRVRRGS